MPIGAIKAVMPIIGVAQGFHYASHGGKTHCYCLDKMMIIIDVAIYFRDSYHHYQDNYIYRN